jgi:hypothetical protein
MPVSHLLPPVVYERLRGEKTVTGDGDAYTRYPTEAAA